MISEIFGWCQNHWGVILAGVGIIGVIGVSGWLYYRYRQAMNQANDASYKLNILMRDMYLICPSHPLLKGFNPGTLMVNASQSEAAVAKSGSTFRGIQDVIDAINVVRALAAKNVTPDDIESAVQTKAKRAAASRHRAVAHAVPRSPDVSDTSDVDVNDCLPPSPTSAPVTDSDPEPPNRDEIPDDIYG